MMIMKTLMKKCKLREYLIYLFREHTNVKDEYI